jgi:hypothetical protein
MPYGVQKRSNRWAIVNRDSGKVAGYSSSKRKAAISASIRNRADVKRTK